MGLSNYLPSSRISQPGVCTSSTRPVSPYEGLVIYETDTDRTMIWNGSSWVMAGLATSGMGVWSSYTPQWTSTGTQPSVGSSSLTGKYCRIGNTIFVEIALVTNGGSSFGTGNYSFSLPVAAKPLWGYHSAGISRVWDQSAQTTYYGHAAFNNQSAGATTIQMLFTPGQWLGANTLITFANGDEILVNATYEANS